LPDSTFKEIENSSAGALHCDGRRRIELLKVERLMVSRTVPFAASLYLDESKGVA
jgi:hypothetical protein